MIEKRVRFNIGDVVKVKDLNKSGHVRVPYYVRNKQGRVVQFCGLFLNPEDLAIGNTAGPAIELYRIAFNQADLWPDDVINTGDQLVLEIYTHWLEEVFDTASTSP